MKFDKDTLKELILTLMIGDFVREAVAESNGESFEQFEKQLKPFLKMAENLGYNDLVERFHGELIPANKLGLEEDKIIEEYNDEEFWFLLQTILGQRDFYESRTESQKKQMEKDIMLPIEVHKFYDKYSKEFDKHGIDRLRIVKGKYSVRKYTDNEIDEFFELDDKESKKI